MRYWLPLLESWPDTILGTGCDDDVEFVFALDLILDGLEKMRAAEA